MGSGGAVCSTAGRWEVCSPAGQGPLRFFAKCKLFSACESEAGRSSSRSFLAGNRLLPDSVLPSNIPEEKLMVLHLNTSLRHWEERSCLTGWTGGEILTQTRVAMIEWGRVTSCNTFPGCEPVYGEDTVVFPRLWASVYGEDTVVFPHTQHVPWHSSSVYLCGCPEVSHGWMHVDRCADLVAATVQ